MFGHILSELLLVWSEIAEVLAFGQKGRKHIELSARKIDFHNLQLLVQLRMIQIVFEDINCIYINLGWFLGGLTFFHGTGVYPMSTHSCPQVACTWCLFSCFQHLCVVLLSASYRHSFLGTSRRMCFMVFENVAVWHAIFGHISDPENLPGLNSFEPRFELTEDLVVVLAERIISMEITLSIFR